MASTPDLLVDRYEVGRLLGAGGMAEVYEGRDRLLARRVAIKVLLPQYSRDPAFLARFKREAQSAASLTHPNIVAVYDTGVQDGTNFIVMEYVSGRTLRDVIRTQGPMSDERAAATAADVCSALAAAHARGIIHRDIKPANIMITAEGQVKVMDFGIARAQAAESITQTQAVVGTAQYISPEQAQGSVVDARTDLYSLGVCLYEMLTGRVPFTGQTPVAIAYQHVRDEPPPLRHLARDVSPQLEAVVAKAMAKDASLRYQDAIELREDLERARMGRQVAAAAPMGDPTQAMTRRSRRMEQQPTAVAGYGEATRQSQMPTRAAQHAPPGYGRRQAAGRPGGGGAGRAVGWGLIALAVLLLGAGGAYFVTNLFQDRGPEPVAVPDVRGQEQSAANSVLLNAGLQVGPPQLVPNEQVASGLVIGTTPANGTKVDAGSTVVLQVSSGPATVDVPDLEGETEEVARQIAQEAGFGFEISGSEFSDQPEGEVIDQEPDEGSPARPESTIRVTVSEGPRPTTTTEPPETTVPEDERDEDDLDGNGVPDYEEDKDGDGITDHEDPDDDNDGTPDHEEGDGDGGGNDNNGEGDGDGGDNNGDGDGDNQ